MDDNIIKGIAGALGKAGAAVIDKHEGTRFYQEALDREKEERAREFALEQLAEEKKKLNNENARRSTQSLVEAFGTRIASAASVTQNITNEAVAILQADAQALAQRLGNSPDLDDMSKEIFATQLNAYLPQLDSLADHGVVNSISSSKTTQERWAALPTVTPRQEALLLTTPKFTEDNLKGEATVLALSNISPDSLSFLSETELAMAKFLEENPGRSYASIARENPALGDVLANQMNPENIRNNVRRGKFIAREMPQMQQELESALAMTEQNAALFSELADIDWKETFTPDNVVTNSKGEFVLRSSHTAVISEATTKLKAGLQYKSTSDLIKMLPTSKTLDGMLKTDLHSAISQRLIDDVKDGGVVELDNQLEEKEVLRDQALIDLAEMNPEDGIDFQIPPNWESSFDPNTNKGTENLKRLEELNQMTYLEKRSALNQRGGYFVNDIHPRARVFDAQVADVIGPIRQQTQIRIRNLISASFLPPEEDTAMVKTYLESLQRVGASLSAYDIPTDNLMLEMAQVNQRQSAVDSEAFRVPFLRYLEKVMMQESHGDNPDTDFADEAKAEMKSMLGTELELSVGRASSDLEVASEDRLERAIAYYRLNAKGIVVAQGLDQDTALALSGEIATDFRATVKELNKKGPEFITRTLDLLGLEKQEGVDPAVTLAIGAML